MSTGIATFDYDGDGLIDIYFPNGAPLPGARYDKPPQHALYRNLGDWRFRDVADQAGVPATAFGLGITIGDYDADGWPDIYLNNFGPGILFHNNGDGTFLRCDAGGRRRGGPPRGGRRVLPGRRRRRFVGPVCRQLYRPGPFETRPANERRLPSYPSPKEYAPLPDTLFRNKGDGTFADISRESGIARHAGRSMGMVCADSDDDGDTDVYVLNDVQQSFFFQNDGHGHFEEVGLVNGVAVGGVGRADGEHGRRLRRLRQRRLARLLQHELPSPMADAAAEPRPRRIRGRDPDHRRGRRLLSLT